MGWPAAFAVMAVVAGALYFLRMSLRYLSGDPDWYRW